MRPARLFAALLSFSLISLPAGLVGASSASAAESIPTRVEMQASAGKLVHDTPYQIVGDVVATLPDGSDVRVPDGEAKLQRKFRGKTSWRTLATAPADETFRFSTRAVANATYRVVYSGGSVTDETTGTAYAFEPSQASKNLWVARDLNARDVQPTPNRYFVKGNVDPGWGRKIVKFERKTCNKCSWKVYARQRTTRTGAYRFPVDFPRPGRAWFYRVVVPKTTSHIKSTSQIFRAVTY